MNDLTGEADFNITCRHRVSKFAFEKLRELPSTHLHHALFRACVRVAPAKFFRVVDAHHVRFVLAVGNFEYTDPFPVDRYRLVANAKRGFDIFVGDRLIGRLTQEILCVYGVHTLAAPTVKVGAYNDVPRSFYRRIRHRKHVTEKAADAAAAVFLLAKLDAGSGSRRSGYFQ